MSDFNQNDPKINKINEMSQCHTQQKFSLSLILTSDLVKYCISALLEIRIKLSKIWGCDFFDQKKNKIWKLQNYMPKLDVNVILFQKML